MIRHAICARHQPRSRVRGGHATFRDGRGSSWQRAVDREQNQGPGISRRHSSPSQRAEAPLSKSRGALRRYLQMELIQTTFRGTRDFIQVSRRGLAGSALLRIERNEPRSPFAQTALARYRLAEARKKMSETRSGKPRGQACSPQIC